MPAPRCTRCNAINEWTIHAERGEQEHEEVIGDAPYAIAGYCSAVCQALDLRSALIDCGMFDPSKQKLDVSPAAIEQAREFCWEDKTFGVGYITRGRS